MGRVTVVVLTLLTFAWIPVIEKSKKGLFMVLQNATMHLAGPIVAIFLLAIFWKRANGPGALSGFVSGSILGIGHLLISVIFEDKCDAYVDESAAGIKQVRFAVDSFDYVLARTCQDRWSIPHFRISSWTLFSGIHVIKLVHVHELPVRLNLLVHLFDASDHNCKFSHRASN